MDDGWIKLHRSVLEHTIFQDDKLWKLWCWCLLKANHKPGNYQGTVIPRGSFITGKHIAKEELGVPPTTWFRRLRQLCEPPFECIAVKSGPKFTMVTVINYDTYQDRDEKSGTEVEPRWNRSGTEMAPIEEQQEQKELREVGRGRPSFHIPAIYDIPEIAAALDGFAIYLMDKHMEAFRPAQRGATYETAFRAGWSVQDFLENVSESIKAGWRGVYAKRDAPPARRNQSRQLIKTEFDR